MKLNDFKGYKTYLVGKAQPTEAKITKLMSIDHYTQCKESSQAEEEEFNEDRKRRETDTNKGDFQRLVYKGGKYDPKVNDLMFMDIAENGNEMTATDQKVSNICI